MKPTNCPSCGVEVRTIKLESGRSVLINDAPHPKGTCWIGEDGAGRVVAPEPKEYAGQMVACDLFIGHGQTCSAIKQRRR